jgi:hypothetical protein
MAFGGRGQPEGEPLITLKSNQDAIASVSAMELSATIRDLAGKQLGLAQALRPKRDEGTW